MDAVPVHTPERKLRHLLFALESLLQLLGGVVLVDAYEQRDEPVVKLCLRKLRRDGHLSLGLWAWVLTELAPTLPDPFVPELSELAMDGAFLRQLERLSDARNQLSHPVRAIDAAEAHERLGALRPDFDALVQSVRFLGGYHLVGVAEATAPGRLGSRAQLVPLRGRRIASRDVPLIFAPNVAHRDVLLIRKDLRSSLVLRPFFTLAPLGEADDVLVLNRFNDAGLTYYATSRPDDTVCEPLLRDDADRTLALWDWLKSSARRELRAAVVWPGNGVTPDGVRRLRGLQYGSDDLPLRELRHLATGGMAEVYVGLDPTSGVARVMKVAQDPNERGACRLITDEYRTLSRVRHEGVVTVYACPSVEGLGPCIVEELFDHPTLQEHLSHGGFAASEVDALLDRLLDAVAALHAQGIVHRDLKPANVLYDRASGVVKVIDLGIARRLDATSHPTTRVGNGTPAIMAPEQTHGGTVSPATDVYALGLTARALYCGLDALGWRHDDHTAAAIPAAMRAVLVRATHEDPAARYPDARAMRVALEEARTSTPPPESASPAQQELPAAAHVRIADGVTSILRWVQQRVDDLRVDPSPKGPIVVQPTRDEPAAQNSDGHAMLAVQGEAKNDPAPPELVRLALQDLPDAARAQLAAEVEALFRRADQRVADLRADVGYLTTVDEFKRDLLAIFDETRATLDALLQQASPSDPDEIYRLDRLGDTAHKVGAWAGAGLAVGGVVSSLGSVLGPVGALVDPTVVGAFKVARRKQRFLDACDAATAALDDARRTVLGAIQTP